MRFIFVPSNRITWFNSRLRIDKHFDGTFDSPHGLGHCIFNPKGITYVFQPKFTEENKTAYLHLRKHGIKPRKALELVKKAIRVAFGSDAASAFALSFNVICVCLCVPDCFRK